MAALSKERDNLLGAIKTYKSLFETTEQLIEELKSKFASKSKFFCLFNNHLPNYNIFDWSKLKPLADDKKSSTNDISSSIRLIILCGKKKMLTSIFSFSLNVFNRFYFFFYWSLKVRIVCWRVERNFFLFFPGKV